MERKCECVCYLHITYVIGNQKDRTIKLVTFTLHMEQRESHRVHKSKISLNKKQTIDKNTAIIKASKTTNGREEPVRLVSRAREACKVLLGNLYLTGGLMGKHSL